MAANLCLRCIESHASQDPELKGNLTVGMQAGLPMVSLSLDGPTANLAKLATQCSSVCAIMPPHSTAPHPAPPASMVPPMASKQPMPGPTGTPPMRSEQPMPGPTGMPPMPGPTGMPPMPGPTGMPPMTRAPMMRGAFQGFGGRDAARFMM